MSRFAPPNTTVVPNISARRTAAALLDLLMVALTMGFLFGDRYFPVQAGCGPGCGIRKAVVDVLFLVFYATIMELAFTQTIDKVLFGVKVVALDGGPASEGAILRRNLGRLTWLIVPLGVWLDFCLVNLSRKHQRLGDFFAGTTVVRSR